MKRGQITIFVIIGLLILFALGFLIYIRFFYVNDAPPQFVQDTVYQARVKSCFEDLSKESLQLIGLSGGSFQGPSQLFEYESVYGRDATRYNQSVHYGARKVDNEGNDLYPFAGPLNAARSPGRYFGSYTLPPLCDLFGSNAYNYPGLEYSCTTYDTGRLTDESSLQEQLQRYIESNISRCVDITESFSGYDVITNDPNVTVTMLTDEVLFDLSYPIELVSEDEDISFTFEDMSFKASVRLKRIHNLMYELIQNDITNLSFSILDDFEGIECIRDNYYEPCARDMTIETYPCPSCNDTLIVITDLKSKINGKSYVFLTALENRKPALNPIEDQIISPGESLSFYLYAIDPDSDKHENGIMGESAYSFARDGEEITPSLTRIDDTYHVTIDGFDTIGTYELTIFACDHAKCDSERFTVEVV